MKKKEDINKLLNFKHGKEKKPNLCFSILFFFFEFFGLALSFWFNLKLYLTNHKRSMTPMKSKITEDTCFKLSNQLPVERFCFWFIRKIIIDGIFTTFGFPQIIVS